MLHKFTYNTVLTNLVINDLYRIEIDLDPKLPNRYAVPILTEFTASSKNQNISFLISKDTNDVIVLKIKTTNLTKNIVNIDQIIVKCSEFSLCEVASTPAVTLTNNITTTPTFNNI